MNEMLASGITPFNSCAEVLRLRERSNGLGGAWNHAAKWNTMSAVMQMVMLLSLVGRSRHKYVCNYQLQLWRVNVFCVALEHQKCGGKQKIHSIHRFCLGGKWPLLPKQMWQSWQGRNFWAEFVKRLDSGMSIACIASMDGYHESSMGLTHYWFKGSSFFHPFMILVDMHKTNFPGMFWIHIA